MLDRIVTASVLAVGLSGSAAAAPADDLLDALGIERVVEVMREEGIVYGDALAEDMFASGAGASWDDAISRIYDAETMEEIVRSEFTEAIGEDDVAPLLEFFESPLGTRIVDLEIEARRALVDEAAEEAARETYRDLDGSGDERLAQIEAFVEAGDLVEQNVAGALNASLAFYRGMVDGDAFAMSEDEMLADVWSQEAETREDTSEWLYAYLLTAYDPLSDEELDRYIELSETEAGQALNRALFQGFNAMYDEISYAMGRAAARQMMGTEL